MEDKLCPMDIQDRKPAETALQEYNRDLMLRMQGYVNALHIAHQVAKNATDERDRVVAEALARVEAMQAVIGALTGSLRPYGLNRKRFTASLQAFAKRTPNEGPRSIQHTVLFEESTRVITRK